MHYIFRSNDSHRVMVSAHLRPTSSHPLNVIICDKLKYTNHITVSKFAPIELVFHEKMQICKYNSIVGSIQCFIHSLKLYRTSGNSLMNNWTNNRKKFKATIFSVFSIRIFFYRVFF